MSKSKKDSHASVLLPTKKKAPETGADRHRLYSGQKLRHKPLEKPGASLCTRCGAVCVEKHWYMDVDQTQDILKDEHMRSVLCPGCKRITENIHCGEVIIEGSFSPKDSEAFLRLIKNTEEQLWHRNPMSKVASILTKKNGIEILTTTSLLAVRIGKDLNKFHKGQLEIKRSPGEKFVRVHWSCY